MRPGTAQGRKTRARNRPRKGIGCASTSAKTMPSTAFTSTTHRVSQNELGAARAKISSSNRVRKFWMPTKVPPRAMTRSVKAVAMPSTSG